MKIYFAHPKDTDSESPELKALGLKFNKAEPSRIQAVGLYTLKQPGYESYLHHLPAFLYANDTQERQTLGRVGYPIRHPAAACFPIPYPPIHLRVKTPTEPFAKAISNYVYNEDNGPKKDGIRMYTVTPKDGVYQDLTRFPYERSYTPNGQVDLPGYAALITALRIFSSFFKTHLYPAYTTPTEQEDYTGRKRMMSEDQQKSSNKAQKTSQDKRVRTSDAQMEVEETQETEEELSDDEEVVLTKAKPQNTAVKPWSEGFADIPNDYGIVMPFVPQLANWDKDMVPHVIERYFLRCLGNNDKRIFSMLDEFNRNWKSSVYSTQAGIMMSHMAKVIDIALPAQARVVPVFEDGVYRGCYLSGANFSVAVKGMITRPVSFKDNEEDLSQLLSRSRFISGMRALCHSSKLSEMMKEAAEIGKAQSAENRSGMESIGGGLTMNIGDDDESDDGGVLAGF